MNKILHILLLGTVFGAGSIFYTFITPILAQTSRQMGVTVETGFVQCGATAALEVGGARGTNHSIVIVNTSATSAYIGLASVTAGAGLVLRQNDAVTLDFFKGPVFCITDTGNAGLRWLQEINVH